MKIIQIGSTAFLLKWLLLGTAVVISLIYIRVWLRRFSKDDHKKILDLLLNTVFLAFILRKVSLFLFEPGLVMKNLFSLLYFTGGSNGLVFAVAFSLFYFIFKAKRLHLSIINILQTLMAFSFSAIGMYHTLSLIFQENDFLYHIFFGLIAVLFLIISQKKGLSIKNIFSFMILFSFLNLIGSLFLNDAVPKLFLLSADQWLYAGLIVISVYYWDKDDWTID